MPLTTSILHDDGVALVSLAGELDLAVASQLEDAVAEVLHAGLRRVLLDLDGLRFCDSSGLGALVRVNRRVNDAGGTCLVAGARGSVQQLLTLTNMERALRLVPEVQPALVRLRQQSTEAPS